MTDILERQVSFLKMTLPETQAPNAKIPAWQQFAGLTLRSVFLMALAVLTFRVALPQNETIATAYDTPNDLIRLVLGFAVCGWLVFELFRTATRRRRLPQLALYRCCRRAVRDGLSLLHLVAKPHGSIRRPVAAFRTASVRVAAPSLARALSM